ERRATVTRRILASLDLGRSGSGHRLLRRRLPRRERSRPGAETPGDPLGEQPGAGEGFRRAGGRCARRGRPSGGLGGCFDTLRADHLTLYGYAKPTSPNLDRFSTQAVVFDQAITSSAWTSPGLVSLLTGLFAARHGVTGPSASAAPNTPTFATVLGAAGYH